MAKNELNVMFDLISAQLKQERANTQITLGKLINELEGIPPYSPVANLKNPGSYRGYYEDLYFEHHGGTTQASELLEICKSLDGKIFHGYKGGEYEMGLDTPIWIAEYGRCGKKLLAVLGDEIEVSRDN